MPFRDPFAIEWEGRNEERDGKIRIITARKAEPHERRKYYDENREA